MIVIDLLSACKNRFSWTGTSTMTDLGPNDLVSTTSSTAAFTFDVAGEYKLCYRLQPLTVVLCNIRSPCLDVVTPSMISSDCLE